MSFFSYLKLGCTLGFCIFFFKPEFSLAQQGASEDAFKQALSNLGNNDPQARRQAAESLGRMRNSAAANDLLKLFSDPVPYVRSAAIESVGLMRVTSASGEIQKVLETDKEPAVRQTCAISLGYIADRNSVASLIKGMKDNHEGTRLACINSLAILRDPSAIESLAKELKNPDARMRNSCAYALGNIGQKEAVAPLVAALKIARSTAPARGEENLVDPSVGATIIRSLGLLGDPSAIPILKNYFEDKDKKVKLTAAQSLLRLGEISGLPLARQFLTDPDASFRRISLELLSELGDANDLEILKKLKADPENSVQQAAAQAIEKISRRTVSEPAQPGKKSVSEPQLKRPSKKAPAKSGGGSTGIPKK